MNRCSNHLHFCRGRPNAISEQQLLMLHDKVHLLSYVVTTFVSITQHGLLSPYDSC